MPSSTTTNGVDFETFRSIPSPPRNQKKKNEEEDDNNEIQQESSSFFFWFLLRTLCLDIPLCLVFCICLVTMLLQHIYQEYYQQILFVRSARSDVQLLDEFTYFERQCTEYDLSTRTIQDMVVDDNDTNDDSISTATAAVHQMMKHGVVVIPDILNTTIIQELRMYIQQKNANIRIDEVYPMSQGYNRLSYGIDASEHPAVSKAIQSVVSHNVTRQLLQSLLGDDDPASAEITSITAYAGAADQVWHTDTKQDGNALKFARTYSHSYSLFLPLQDITQDMGATDICPGTHYCANNLETMCERNKLGLHLVHTKNNGTNESYFKAGDGALLNQHVWHRGGAQRDPNAPERIVFILSFLARPNFTGNDARQLSRGTYFHQKWNMWGHTLQDLMDPALYMRKPFSILRCLSLWKPPSQQWGYDLVTSAFMRFVNEQLEDEDFEQRFLPKLDQIHFPTWLRGRHLQNESQRITWTVFLQETIQNVTKFMQQLTVITHGMYILGLMVLSLVYSVFQRRNTTVGKRLWKRSLLRLWMTHVPFVLLTLGTAYQIRTSKWGHAILSGKALMRPFPEIPILTYEESKLLTTTGRTTFPTRNDVLFGTRYDALFLGSYDQWLQYHPGNIEFQKLLSQSQGMVATSTATKHNTNNHTITLQLVDFIVEQIMEVNHGRFLQQDWRTGDWRILNNDEIVNAIVEELLVSGNPLLSKLQKKVKWMMAEYRFGGPSAQRRSTAMSRISQVTLIQLKQKLFQLDAFQTTTRSSSSSRSNDIIPTENMQGCNTNSLLTTTQKMAILQPTVIAKQLQPIFGRRSLLPYVDEFRPGSLVWVQYDADENDHPFEWFPGAIMEVNDNKDGTTSFVVSFEDGSFDYNVDISVIRHYESVTEGDRVEGCFSETSIFEDCWPGTVLRVMPGGYVSILYDDGDLEWIVAPNRYYVPPFRHPTPVIYL